MVLTLDIEKPAAGGRMIARHEGRVVLVSGAIPGERVAAETEGSRAGVLLARTVHVERASPDRRPPICDPACGGSAYAHIAYERQCAIKSEIVADAFARIAKHPLAAAVAVRPSPDRGYRMRARLHVRGGRIGFFREGSHMLCDIAATGQLLPSTTDAIDAAVHDLGIHARAVRDVELSENIPANQRAVLVDPADTVTVASADAVVAAFVAAGFSGAFVRGTRAASGSPYVSDTLDVRAGSRAASVSFVRHVSAFFQANRYLLTSLVESVVAQVPAGSLVDLYAGAGLFGLSWASLDFGDVIAVEGDRQGSADLERNARSTGRAVRTFAMPVERFLTEERVPPAATLLVDPPRTGMTRDATDAIVGIKAPRVVYVSCDVATLARDVRRFLDSGYALAHLEAFDLFPNTPHVETLAVLTR